MKQFTTRIIATIGTVALVLSASAGTVSAVGNTTDNGNGSTRLDDAKLKACQNREAKIEDTMSRIANRATKRLQLFEQITEKVKNLYEAKNLSVANYDELMAKVTAARNTAQIAIQTEHTQTSQFSCDSDDPKGSIAAFKNQQKTELAAMKNYRLAIKDLVSSIKASLVSTDGEQ